MMPLPRWMSDKERRRDRNRRSGKQERKRANELGGKVQAGSGSSRRAPQDINAPEILEQIKYTDRASTTVDVRDLIVLRDDAERAGKFPQYTIDFERHGIRFVGRVEILADQSRARRRV